MHHALEIHEILLSIFDRCHGPDSQSSELAMLARTCCTFKEPALDLLWEELADLSPLARCLPDACHLASPARKCYAFNRLLTQAEWVILQSYTRRIRRIQGVSGLGRKSIKAISETRTVEPLFQNLRLLRFAYTTKTTLLLRLPLPSIVSFDIDFFNTHLFHTAITSLSKFPCDMSIRLHELGGLDTNSLVQLSRITVTQLELKVDTALACQVAASDLTHLFPHLLELILSSKSLADISQFLSKIRMPAVGVLGASIWDNPSRQDVSSFLTSFQTSDIGPAFQNLSLFQVDSYNSTESESDSELVLGMQDFRACMAFSNLRQLNWSIQCRVDLTTNDVLTLASAWPRLEQLVINETRGWGTSSGITPYGLVRLLKMCPSLRFLAIVLDTRDFVQPPESDESLELSLVSNFFIEVIDSTIEAEAVPAVAEFFARISPHFNPLMACYWSYWEQKDLQIRDLYHGRWIDVHQRIEKVVSKHP